MAASRKSRRDPQENARMQQEYLVELGDSVIAVKQPKVMLA
jgi:uncharacterized membrane protein